jgi:OPA family glycerol-3-phosphate transporter-like MFS transporter 1/2
LTGGACHQATEPCASHQPANTVCHQATEPPPPFLPALPQSNAKDKEEAESIHFMDAWAIPGVAQFAFCLFFSKLIAYTFLYWLPYYIKSTRIEGRHLSSKEAGDLSVLFDVGGVAGGVMAGHLSDKTGASALVSTCFTLLSVPLLYMYR